MGVVFSWVVAMAAGVTKTTKREFIHIYTSKYIHTKFILILILVFIICVCAPSFLCPCMEHTENQQAHTIRMYVYDMVKTMTIAHRRRTRHRRAESTSLHNARTSAALSALNGAL